MANRGVMVWLWSDLKVSNFVRWTWMEQAQLCTMWKRLCRDESWRLWGAKPAGYSLFDIYVSGVVSASCLGIWRNFHWEKLIFLLQTKRARIHEFWAMPAIQVISPPAVRSSPDVPSSEHLSGKEIAGFWYLEYLEPIRCKQLCSSACQKNVQRLKKLFTDSNDCWLLVF